MDAILLPVQPKIPKPILRGIGLVTFLGIIALSQTYLQGLPILAKDLLAHNTAITPILKTDTRNMEKEIQDYNTSVRSKYRGGIVYDVDTGVKHIKITKYYQGRPVKINIVEINQNLNNNLKIKPQLASDKLASKASITRLAKKENSIIAINGTFFKPQTGVPLGTLMIDGKMYTGPIYDRVAMGIFENQDNASTFDMTRIQFNGKISNGKLSAKIDNINQPRMLSTYVIAYTPEWGKVAPPSPKEGMQLAIKDNKILQASANALEIPEGGYVIVGPKSKLSQFYGIKKVDVNLDTIPNWQNVSHIISGGPYLVKNGERFVDIKEQKLAAIGGRNPRTAIGYTKDNTLILVAVDGRENSSIGLTLYELSSLMKELGCVNAMNLDGGGSTVMYVNGKIVNSPHVQGGIALSNALTVSKTL